MIRAARTLLILFFLTCVLLLLLKAATHSIFKEPYFEEDPDE